MSLYAIFISLKHLKIIFLHISAPNFKLWNKQKEASANSFDVIFYVVLTHQTFFLKFQIENKAGISPNFKMFTDSNRNFESRILLYNTYSFRLEQKPKYMSKRRSEARLCEN